MIKRIAPFIKLLGASNTNLIKNIMKRITFDAISKWTLYALKYGVSEDPLLREEDGN